MIETVLTAVDIRTAPRYPANDQVGTYPSDADEVALAAKSTRDFNSLNYMRKQAVWATRVRRVMIGLFGPPTPNTDDGPHTLSPPGM